MARRKSLAQVNREDIERAREARARLPPTWCVRVVDADGRPWYLDALWYRSGSPEELAVSRTLYEAAVPLMRRVCADGVTVLVDLAVPIAALRVRQWDMTPVVSCLVACGVHGECYGPSSTEADYRF